MWKKTEYAVWIKICEVWVFAWPLAILLWLKFSEFQFFIFETGIIVEKWCVMLCKVQENYASLVNTLLLALQFLTKHFHDLSKIHEYRHPFKVFSREKKTWKNIHFLKQSLTMLNSWSIWSWTYELYWSSASAWVAETIMCTALSG
jgi:hypothetical protein